MCENDTRVLFAILRFSIDKNPQNNDINDLSSPEIISKIASLAEKHDVAHLLARGLSRCGLVQEAKAFESEAIKAIYRYEQMRRAYSELCVALEAAKIPFLPLKGSVIRKYYPEPWMRTSCDIDVLVHPENLENAIIYLTENCNYIEESRAAHDVSLFTPQGVHIELHFDLIEAGRANSANTVLSDVWSNVLLKSGYEYWYEMSDDMFYFYHIAHMAKHFENGGCGIRPFVDLWILDHVDNVDKEKRAMRLEQGGLAKFAMVAQALSCVWLGDAEHDEITTQMESYILKGGVYGTSENRVAVQQQKKGGKIGYLMSKVFLPYDVIKYHYPMLQKHRWLMPFMQVRRWFKLVFCGHAKRAVREMKYNSSISSNEAEQVKTFLENIGLK